MQSDDQDAAFLAGADAPPVPAADEPTPTPPQPEDSEAKAAEPEGDKPDEAKPEGESDDGEPKEKRTPWFQRRIDDLTREKWEARREADALKAALEAQRAAPQPEGEAPAKDAAADPVAIARQMVETQRFNDDCNRIYEAGAKEHADFDAALGNFRLLGGIPPVLVEAAMEAGDAHKVLYQLGKDPDEAARILALPPVRMAAAVAKLANKPAAPKPVSKAPDPPTPIGGRGTVEADPEKMGIDDWMKWHDDQQARKRA